MRRHSVLGTVSPSLQELVTQIRDDEHSNLFPIFVESNADLETPVSAYLKVARGSKSFLFESTEGDERISRYSFIGTEPYKVLQTGKLNNTDPLCEVEAELAKFTLAPRPGLPSLTGGAVGYVGYECVRYFEPSVTFNGQHDPLQLPESVFMFTDSLVVFDRFAHTITVIAHVRVGRESRESPAELERLYKAAVDRIRVLCDRLSGPLPFLDSAKVHTNPNTVESEINVGEEGYRNFVTSLKENIVNGDIIQAVPSQRIKRRLNNVSAFDIYRQLRTVNPSPYLFFLELGDFQIVGASPELLVKVEGGRVITHPIAGTRKRGNTPEEDAALEKELLASEKECAEHVMLVDLGRNDIGRVSEPGTVRVDKMMEVVRYSHVMHIISTVSGVLKKGLSTYDAFRSVFPAGTVSGAPKIRAMQLVADLEHDNRRVYAGAVGYFSFSGVMDTCIAIRTLVVRDGFAYLQAGGGIVYDSDPEEERQESINKMMALAKAIDVAEECAVRGEMGDFLLNETGEYDEGSLLPKYFGNFGGSFVSEPLVEPLREIAVNYVAAMNDAEFQRELNVMLKDYVGRPTPLYFAKRLTDHCGGAKLWLKREDLAHTGAHKINNGLASCLLAKRMGKTRIVAETGAGQHGVATATACALFGMECHVYMGEEDMKRQALNVFRMRMLGSEVIPVTAGTRTLKDAVTEALRDFVTNVTNTFYCIGSVVGPHPYPAMVRGFQSVIGRECRRQMLDQAGKLPDVCVACVGGGSNSIGLFYPFLEDSSVRLIGVEAAGLGIDTDKNAASIISGSSGILHGMRTFVLQDSHGQISDTHSISAGLDYPGVGPEHAHLHASKRATYVAVTDDEALQGLQDLTRLEGIIPALESSHAVYYAMELAKKSPPDMDIVINLSGRGDKDMPQVSRMLGAKLGSSGVVSDL